MIAFVVAMDNESKAVAKAFAVEDEELVFGRTVVRGHVGGNDAVMVVCGVGKVNAAAGAQLALSRYGADRLVNVGVAGGLRSGMRPGETYTGVRAVQYDFDLAEINGTVRGTLNEYDTPYLPLVPIPGFAEETVATGDNFSDDEDDFRFISGVLGAGVRDMELGAVAHVALRAGVPVSALKTITDVHGAGTSTPAQYAENLALGLSALSAAVYRAFAAA